MKLFWIFLLSIIASKIVFVLASRFYARRRRDPVGFFARWLGSLRERRRAGASWAENQLDTENNPWEEAAQTLGIHHLRTDDGKREEITGKVSGNKVLVDRFCRTSRGQTQFYTRFHVTYPRPLDVDLCLRQKGRHSGLEPRLDGEFLEMEDESFDKHVLVKSKDTEAAREFLTPARRLRLRLFIASCPAAVIGSKSISYTEEGFVNTARRLVGTVQRMTRIANHMWESLDEDNTLDRAIAVRREKETVSKRDARPEKPVAREPSRRESFGPKLMSCLPDRTPVNVDSPEKETPEVPQTPQDVAVSPSVASSPVVESPAAELPASELPASELPPSEVPLPPAAQESAREPEPERPEVDLDVASVCGVLFDPVLLSLDTHRIFGERYKGQTVRWTGEISYVEKYPFDFIFGSKPGTKVTIEVHSVGDSISGMKVVRAAIQLPEDAEEEMRGLMGERVTFTGPLHDVDGFTQILYVTDANVVTLEPA